MAVELTTTAPVIFSAAARAFAAECLASSVGNRQQQPPIGRLTILKPQRLHWVGLRQCVGVVNRISRKPLPKCGESRIILVSKIDCFFPWPFSLHSDDDGAAESGVGQLHALHRDRLGAESGEQARLVVLALTAQDALPASPARVHHLAQVVVVDEKLVRLINNYGRLPFLD